MWHQWSVMTPVRMVVTLAHWTTIQCLIELIQLHKVFNTTFSFLSYQQIPDEFDKGETPLVLYKLLIEHIHVCIAMCCLGWTFVGWYEWLVFSLSLKSWPSRQYFGFKMSWIFKWSYNLKSFGSHFDVVAPVYRHTLASFDQSGWVT